MATVDTAQTVQNIYPTYWENANQNISNSVAGLPAYIQNTQQNWYDQPLSAGTNANLQSAYTQAGNASTPWIQGIQGAQTAAGGFNPYQTQASGALGSVSPYLQGANAQYQSGSTYNPATLQQYLNPYTQQAAQATVSDNNRNLNENLMPSVNSTFTGAGQFGSSRNSEFASRALRDTQEANAKALAGANYSAYTNANQTYSDWANKDIQAGQGMAGLAGQQTNLGQAYGQLGTNQLNYAQGLGSLAGQGATLGQQQLTNLSTMGKTQYDIEQAAKDKSYTDWMQQTQFPLSALQSVGQTMGAMSGGVKPDTQVPTQNPDAVTKALSAMQIMNSGLNDSSIQQLLAQIGISQ